MKPTPSAGRRGRLIVFEGIDGSGKSSTQKRVAAALQKDGIDVLVTREESEGPVGEWVRRSISDKWPPLTTLHLFLADRAHHVATIIEPALAAGRTVLCDRFLHSTVAYQAVTQTAHDAKGLLAMHAGWCPMPDKVLLFDSDPQKAVARTQGRSTRTPYERAEFLGKVRANYLALAKADPKQFAVLDADQPMDKLAAAALAAVRAAL